MLAAEFESIRLQDTVIAHKNVSHFSLVKEKYFFTDVADVTDAAAKKCPTFMQTMKWSLPNLSPQKDVTAENGLAVTVYHGGDFSLKQSAHPCNKIRQVSKDVATSRANAPNNDHSRIWIPAKNLGGHTSTFSCQHFRQETSH